MRRRLMLRDERGATLVIVVLSLVAIFAMLVLTVDVGGLLFRRRAMVNGADAAALAAAQSCATTTDSDVPGTIAYQYAHANISDLTPANGGILNTGTIGGVAPTANCDTGQAGHITVKYTTPQDLFFAGVLGISGPTPVVGQATAAWAPLAGGFAVPIVLESGHLQGDCDIPNVPVPDPANPPVCAFWYDNGNLGSADWGFMNLDKWNVAGNTNCSNAGASNRSDWIINNYPNELDLNGTPPGSADTYVCVDTGHTTRDWQDLKTQEGQIKLFPVNQCTQTSTPYTLTGQVSKTGAAAPCPITPDKYDIIGFAPLLIQHVYQGDDSLAIGTTGASGTCGNNGTALPGSLSYGQTLDLAAFADANCGAPGSPDTIPYASVVVKQGNGNNATTYQKCQTFVAGCDYVYDEATKTLTWYHSQVTTEKISLDWSFVGTPGACPGHTSDPNAICLVTAWTGPLVKPGHTGSGRGNNFGAMGIQLCDLALKTCPDQQ